MSISSASDGAVPSEGARERELHRYYGPWLETFHATKLPLWDPDGAWRDDGHVPQSSSDKALTAFTQLGALRLRCNRGVITLIDGKSQLILAEATQSLSLMDDNVHGPDDGIWFGNSMLPRGQGMSQYALRPGEYTTVDPNGKSYTAKALVVPDCALDDRFKHKGFVGRGVTFYCGVPLVTKLGHPIGVYCVIDNNARPSLSPDELRFMVDMATIVIQHLEVIKNDRARARGEKLIQGIGTFLEGRSMDDPISKEQHSPQPTSKVASVPPATTPAKQGSKRPTLPRNKSSGGQYKGLNISDANKVGRKTYPSQAEEEHPQDSVANSQQQNTPSTDRLTHKSLDMGDGGDATTESVGAPVAPVMPSGFQQEAIFLRAAMTLRRAISADGVIFVDASSANLSQGAYKREKNKDPGKLSRTSTRDINPVSNLALDSKDHDNEDSLSSDNHATSDQKNRYGKAKLPCEIIAQSLLEKSSHISLHLSQRNLFKLIRRYPQGKCYAFDENGRLVVSDVGTDSTITFDIAEVDEASEKKNLQDAKPPTKKHALLNLLPGARTIAFVPLWDYTKDRWHSATILWSSNPAKLMNIQDDLVYLTAFGNSIMNELARLNLLISDSAKARLLANISHELRSPLHGILGSIQFLHESPLDDFQSNMVISVETCGKTLLDTVNHVLDFAKLNNLSKLGQRGITQATTSDSSLTSVFDLAVVVEEAVEAVYAGQVFRTANADALEGKGLPLASYNRAMQQRQDTKTQIAKGQAVMSSTVRLTLNIDGGKNWHVSSQPGAIRRVIMNLLGNSLKYTVSGSIDVSLELDRSREWEDDSHLHVCMIVTDTGQGMSEGFVKNHAFTAFSQENSLTSGTGLGLSIIRAIVDSLGGKIDMRSQKDIGTEIKIWLSLQSAPAPDEKTVLSQIQEHCGGLSMCLLDPRGDMASARSEGVSKTRSVGESLVNLTAQWFSMHVFTAPNMTGVSADFFVYPEPPPIEYLLHHHGENADGSETPVLIFCQNAFQANSLRANGIHHLTEIGRIIEVVAQPIGPQKLSKTLLRCMQRIRKMDKTTSENSRQHVQREISEEDEIKAPAPHARLLVKDASRPSQFHPSQLATSPKSSRPRIEHRATAPANPEVAGEKEMSSPKLDRLPESPPPRVLVVDDNEINLQLLVAFVRRAKLPFESASDGLQALEAYKKAAKSEGSRFQYIICDISMPIMDGITATREIRSFEREHKIQPPVQIIALTGMGEQGDVQEEASEAGFNKFLTKPVKFQVLRDMLLSGFSEDSKQ